MIDDKKIEEACDRALKRSVFNDNVHAYPYVSGFYDCAKWAINEFLKDLWHSYNEVPTRKDKDILQFFESYSADSEDDYDEYFELAHTREGFTQETWEDFMNIGGTPSNWLYIEDLFPKTQKVGNHD